MMRAYDIFLLLGLMVTTFGCEDIAKNGQSNDDVSAPKTNEPSSNDSEFENKEAILTSPNVVKPPVVPIVFNPYERYVPRLSSGGGLEVDTDEDGIPNRDDNCPTTPNPDQIDEDDDHLGKACDCDDNYAGVGEIHGDARYVDPRGRDLDGENDCLDKREPCRTIAHALTQAEVLDTIVLAKATFAESGLVIDKGIWIVGHGRAQSIIDAQSLDRIFTINAEVSANFCGLSLTHGFKEANEKGGAAVIASSAIVNFYNTAFNHNTAGSGGALSNAGEVTIRNSDIVENNGEFGGGIHHEAGSVTLLNSVVEANRAIFGAGIENTGGNLDIIDSTLSLNQGTFGGALRSSTSEVRIDSSTFINNGAVYGGGIQNVSSIMTITNSTLSGNTGIFGGGIQNNSDPLEIANSTIAHNEAITSGGGIDNFGAATISHSIVAHNSLGGDCANGGTLTSNGFNLESATSCNFNQPGDLQNAFADLLPLSDNGGQSVTHALGPNSDAIDAGDTDCGVTVDQRDYPRPVDAIGFAPDGGLPHCDIGSYERQ